MKPFSVNLAKFKKIAHDKKSTTLRYPEGHEIKIVHSALPAIQRKQLEGLPMYAEGTPDAPVSAADAQKPVVVNVEQPPPASSVTPMASTPVSAQVEKTPQNANLLAPDNALDVPAAVNLEQKAAREQQAIGAAQAKEDINITKGRMQQISNQAEQDQAQINNLNHVRDTVNKQLQAGMIKPNAYLENQTAGQKILNAIGLIAGGFKQGIVGGNNPALDFLNNQVERDVAAQRENQGARKSIYGMYHQAYGDNILASNMAKAHAYDMQAQQAHLVGAQLGTAQSKANADAFAADRMMKANELIQNNAGRLGTLNVGAPLTQNSLPAPGQQTAQAPMMGASAAAGPGIEQSGLGTLARGASSILFPDESRAADREELAKPRAYSIVSPNAQRVIGGMQYSTPADKADYEKTTEQLKQAQQAEKVLNGPNGDGVGGIHDLVQRMYKNSGSGSYLSGAGLHVRENARDAAESVPVIGQALRGAIDLAPKDQATKQYETGKAALLSDLATGLQGVLAPTDIEKIVKPNLPALGDSPKDVADKERAMVSSILKALKTNMLEKKGVYLKPKI